MREPGEGPEYHDVDGALVCDECGEARVPGDWPFCGPKGHSPGKFGSDPFEPYLDPNIVPPEHPEATSRAFIPALGREVRGVWIESREHRRRLMRENNLDWAPRPMGEGAEV